MSLFKSTKQAENCPQCQALLQIKRGKQGLFLGCSNYPKCNYLKPLHQSSHIIKTLEQSCPECQSPLQLKQGGFGIFIGCSNYPHCHFIVQEHSDAKLAFECPECQKHLLVARRGRTGKLFYGCEGFPECKFTLTAKPIAKSCPLCHCKIATIKKQRGKTAYLCANKTCQHLFNGEENA